MSRLPVLVSAEVQVLLSNAAQVTLGFCVLYDRFAAAPTVEAALTVWRERGDMGGRWYAHTARQMTGRIAQSPRRGARRRAAMLDDDGPDGGPGGERAPRATPSLATVPARRGEQRRGGGGDARAARGRHGAHAPVPQRVQARRGGS